MEGKHIGESEELEVTVLMSDIRSYSSIAERTAPTQLAAQLNEHRAAMNRRHPRRRRHGDAVRRRRRDGGVRRPVPAGRPRRPGGGRGARDAPRRSTSSTRRGRAATGRSSCSASALSTGKAAAALLGSEERLEYTLVGDTVNLAQRLQDMARPGGPDRPQRGDLGRPHRTRRRATANPPELVKGRDHPRHHLSDRARHLEPDMTTTEPCPHRRRRSTRDLVLDVRGVRRTFEAENAPVRALRGADFQMRPRRVRRHHGTVGLRQVDPAQPRRRASTRPTRARSCSPARRSPARPRTSWPACAASTSASSSSSSTCSRA